MSIVGFCDGDINVCLSGGVCHRRVSRGWYSNMCVEVSVITYVCWKGLTAVCVVVGFVTAECVHDCDSNMCVWRVM